MSNLTFIKDKNQIGIGTNKIELTNSLSSALNIKKNDDSYSFLDFNTSSNTIGVGTDMSANELSTEAGKAKVASIPSARLGTVEEIGSIVNFLASDASSYITGQTINANGGMYFSSS